MPHSQWYDVAWDSGPISTWFFNLATPYYAKKFNIPESRFCTDVITVKNFRKDRILVPNIPDFAKLHFWWCYKRDDRTKVNY